VPRVSAVISSDGTTIAYEQRGEGRPLILIDGALCTRTFGPMPKLVPLLAHHFAVISYDRRGRGTSGDTAPYAVEREIEDIQALIEVAGGSAFLYGMSSGAVLALRVAASGPGVTKLALYEPPLTIAGSPLPVPPDRKAEITALVRSGRRGDAVTTFLRMVGAPGVAILMTRIIPGVWSKLTAVAHTLPYDFAILGETGAGKPLPAELEHVMASISVPTLVGVGGKSPAWMRHAVETVAGAIPGAAKRVLAGQRHNVSANAIAPALTEFFSA
jgi:pimeloyl-ACP methyl ester carboxylesterase